MSLVKISKAYINELKAKQTMPRTPEPHLLMSQADQVIAYNKGGEPDGSLAPIHFYAIEQASKTFQICRRVLDLGVGTGHVITKMALVNPRIQFLGIDLSEEMLNIASQQVEKFNLKNVILQKADMTKLDQLNQKFDGVMSTLALHHLPTNLSLNTVIAQSLKVMMADHINLFFLI